MTKLKKADSRPFYQQLKVSIQNKIKDGDYREGERIPSVSEFCAKLKVSTITVRRAISDLVSEGLLTSTPGKGTFVSLSKNNKRENGKDLIGIVFPESLSSSTFSSEIFQGVREVMSAAGYHIVTAASNFSVEKENRGILELREKGVAGILIAPSATKRTPASIKAIERFCKEGFPFVFLDMKIIGVPVDYVTTDNENGGYEATSYLLKLGHHRIAFIMGIEANTVQERFAGYQRALAESNVPFDPIMIKLMHVDLKQEQSGYRSAMELLHLASPPTAVFACNDAVALGSYHACHKLGVKIPQDLSVIGYDDLFFSRYLAPPLTTINQPFFAMGQKAAKLLIRRIKKQNGGPKQIILQSHLVERDSCSVPGKGVIKLNRQMAVEGLNPVLV